MYLTFADYQSLGGKLAQTEFNIYCFKASTKIDYITFNRLKSLTFENLPDNTKDAIRYCTFELIKLYQLKDSSTAISGEQSDSSDNISAGITKMSNDGVSITYNTQSALDIYTNVNSQIEKTCDMYLSDIVDSNSRKLTYRGLYKYE